MVAPIVLLTRHQTRFIVPIDIVIVVIVIIIMPPPIFNRRKSATEIFYAGVTFQGGDFPRRKAGFRMQQNVVGGCHLDPISPLHSTTGAGVLLRRISSRGITVLTTIRFTAKIGYSLHPRSGQDHGSEY